MGENKNGLLFLFYSILFNKIFLIWFHLKQYAVDILTLYYIKRFIQHYYMKKCQAINKPSYNHMIFFCIEKGKNQKYI